MAHPLKMLDRLGHKPRGVIHVGANLGGEVLDYEKADLDAVICIEPLDEPFAKVSRLCRRNANFFALQEVIGAANDVEVEFHETSNQGASSSVLKPTKFLEYHPDKPVVRVHSMKTKTLDSILQEAPFRDFTFDCLVADVQGYELEVLKGAEKALKNVKYAYLECTLNTQYENSCDLNDLLMFLAPRGFSLIDLQLNGRLMGDGLFMKMESQRGI